jgi:hypothetical protein
LATEFSAIDESRLFSQLKAESSYSPESFVIGMESSTSGLLRALFNAIAEEYR